MSQKDVHPSKIAFKKAQEFLIILLIKPMSKMMRDGVKQGKV